MLRRSHATLFITASFLAVSTFACSVFFSTNKEQCATDDDCRGRGAGFAGTRCSLANICVDPKEPVANDAGIDSAPLAPDSAGDPMACATQPLQSPDPSKQVEVSIRYVDFTSGEAPAEVGVRLCASTDQTCANPRATLEGTAFDAGPDGGRGFVQARLGTVRATVELGFEGFFEARTDLYTPTVRYTSPPLRAAKTDLDQVILRKAEIDYLADLALGKPQAYDSVGHGLVFLIANDCNRGALGGVSFSTSAVDPTMALFYVINTTPSTTETKTDVLGRGGYVNVPPGLHTFTMSDPVTKKRIGSARIVVRAGTATTVAILPSP